MHQFGFPPIKTVTRPPPPTHPATLIRWSSHLELQPSREGRHPAVAQFRQHRWQRGQQHERILGVLLHRAQISREFVVICQSNVHGHSIVQKTSVIFLTDMK